MSKIIIKSADVVIPIFDSNSRSLKKSIFSKTGKLLQQNGQNFVSIQALKDINLSLISGDRVGILGSNGAGKSTLLRLLSGVYSPTKGSVEIVGSVGTLIDIALGIDLEATGRENIYIRGAYLGMSQLEMATYEYSIINFSDLLDSIDLPVRTYSSGMQMRLAFAISTIVNKDILLMDEWLSVGDQEFAKKAEDQINNLIREAKILVIASHSLELIKRICNKIIYMENGKILKIESN
jgi:lipopolysaccharide transport system ATP-binding protein